MSLPMNFDLTLATFGSTHCLAVYDSFGAYVHGAWQEGELARRNEDILAIVLSRDIANLEFLQQGNSSNSGITLHTKNTLYFNDVNNQEAGQETRQSYVDYQGYRFKVVGVAFIQANNSFNTYNCVRFVQ